VRVRATPDRHDDGARLADEIIAVLAAVTREHQLPEHHLPEQRLPEDRLPEHRVPD